MTIETKLRVVLEEYHNTMDMVESKLRLDKEKVVERNDLSTKEMYSLLAEIRMEEIERETAEQNKAISQIISIFKEAQP